MNRERPMEKERKKEGEGKSEKREPPKTTEDDAVRYKPPAIGTVEGPPGSFS